MSWRDHLGDSGIHLIAPYFGQRSISRDGRSWNIHGRPREHGWFRWQTNGRSAVPVEDVVVPDESWRAGSSDQAVSVITFGTRIIIRSNLGQRWLGRVLLMTPGPVFRSLRVVPAEVPGTLSYGAAREQRYVVIKDEPWALGTTLHDVIDAFDEGKESLDHIAGGIPLVLREAFYLAVEDRKIREEMAREARARAAAAELAAQAAARQASFEERARLALAMGGAEYIGSRDTYVAGEKEVRYRFRHERLACVVVCDTLGIVEAGICLTDHYTGEKGDRLLTLESLPSVVGQAIDEGLLHPYREW